MSELVHDGPAVSATAGPPALLLDPSQEAAVELALRAPLGCITGGPGTGKTTTLRTALDRLDVVPHDPTVLEGAGEDTSRYVLASPTGKAAKRMQEATGRPACTVHRLLDYGPHYETGALVFRRNASRPIPSRVVVLDEASMLDVELAAALMEALHPTTRLLLVGDAHQLPSVGPGRVFADLIESKRVPVATLTTLHRAAQQSWICRSAPVVLRGDVPDLAPCLDFRWCPEDSRIDAANRIVDIVTKALPARGVVGAQVLIPQRTGDCGVDAINAKLQAELNPEKFGSAGWKLPSGVMLRPGDRVIQTSNDYTRMVFNGEVGTIAHCSKESIAVAFDGRERAIEYSREAANALRLAYALTIHRSQGSEWPWVVVVCHSTHSYMLSRALLYTAITRAKEGVVLVGDLAGLKRAVSNGESAKRNTGLVARIQAPVRAEGDTAAEPEAPPDEGAEGEPMPPMPEDEHAEPHHEEEQHAS